MKKNIILISLLLFNFAYSQCTIIGSSTIALAETETYTIDKTNAQCADCYLWVNNTRFASIESDAKQSSIQLKGNIVGNTTLSVVMLSSNGVVQCNKEIAITQEGYYNNSFAKNAVPGIDSSEKTTITSNDKNFTPPKPKKIDTEKIHIPVFGNESSKDLSSTKAKDEKIAEAKPKKTETEKPVVVHSKPIETIATKSPEKPLAETKPKKVEAEKPLAVNSTPVETIATKSPEKPLAEVKPAIVEAEKPLAVNSTKNYTPAETTPANNQSEAPTTQPRSNCNISFYDFREEKYGDELVALVPNYLDNNYTISWTVNFQNGEQKTFTDKVPQLNYSRENEISTIVVKLISPTCERNFTKTYEKFFWKFF